MKRVDQMIKYLSGELSPEESLAFEKELKENPQLKEDFSSVSLAYNAIAHHLRKQDEEAFTEALSTAMKKSLPEPPTIAEAGKGKNRSSRWWFPLIAAAASAALLLTIIRSPNEAERIYSSCYDPSNDPVIQSLEANTRGETPHQAIFNLWQKGEYEKCATETEKQLAVDSTDQCAMLFYLLSSMEMNQVDMALDKINMSATDLGQPLGQSLLWYKALALVRRDAPLEAAALIKPLSEHPGPYEKDANKLKKKLRK